MTYRPVTAIYDANVLYPAPLRDLLVRLAHAGLVRGRWTDAIHDEWIRNVCANNPGLAPEKLQRTRMLMNAAVRDCLITGYEDIIDSLELPDANDRHVLASAIHIGADAIVTFNLKVFPADILSTFGVKALHPDKFLEQILEHSSDSVCALLKRQRESLRNPPVEVDELLDTLARQGMADSVTRLRRFTDLL